MHPDWLVPDWNAPGVGAVMTTRHGGVSKGPFASMNLRAGIGDDDDAVRHNQATLAREIGVKPFFLHQVHGTRVLRLAAADAAADVPQEADACVTTDTGIACTAQVADCLPVLFAAPGGVGAAHAGWRGLAGGVLEATVARLCEAAGCEPGQVHAWLGPCIGPHHFEVGSEVLHAFGAQATDDDPVRFRLLRPGKWLANLPQLARDRLQRQGLHAVSGGAWCTVEQASRFFSFRRDRVTGRMVAAVWRVG